MPITFNGKQFFKEKDTQDIQEILSNTYGCLNCGKDITYNVSKSKYCFECQMKYPKQIKEKEAETDGRK